MATTTTRGPDASDPTGGGSRGPSAEGPRPILATPVVYDRRGSKKKKRGRRKKKYTRGTKAPQRFLFGTSRAAYRVANSFSRGLSTFVKRSNRSGKKRRDGMLRDSLRNASRAFGRTASQFGRAPYEIAKRIGTGRVRRTFRIFLPGSR